MKGLNGSAYTKYYDYESPLKNPFIFLAKKYTYLYLKDIGETYFWKLSKQLEP